MPEDSARTAVKNEIRGRNPHFYDDPNIDRLLTMIMELASEVSVMRDRLDTHERLAASKGLYSHEDIEAFSPSDDEAKERAAWRGRFLDRLLKGLYASFDSGPTGSKDKQVKQD